MRTIRIVLGAAVFACFLSSCSPVKHLGPEAWLLNKNVVKSDKAEMNEGIKSILKQKPNRKILGLFRFHLGVYTLANRGRQSTFKKWIKRTIGEEPVVLDPLLTLKSHAQVLQYSQNEGYFNAEVFDTTIYKKGKKANVIYSVKTEEPYLIRNIKYDIPDKVVASIVLSDTGATHLRSGNRFRTSDFQDERERVTRRLRNMGYYDFNQLYISYDIDSSLKSRQVDVTFIIAGTSEKLAPGDSLGTGNHKMYLIKDIFVQTDYDPLSKVVRPPTDTIHHKGYHFLSSYHKRQYKPESLLMRIFIQKNDFYKISNSDATYNGLAGLSLFKFINIRYEPTTADSLLGYWLNSYISLTPSPKQSYKVELEGTNNGGNFGVGGNFTYINKNSFKGSESVQFRFLAKIESIPDFVDSTANETSALSLNTYEFGPEITLRIPRFLWPLARFNHTRSSNPATLFTIAYNFQKRPEYTRNLLTLSSGFEFRETRHKKHFVYPAEINYSNYNLTQAFIDKLKEINDLQLTLYYQSYLITNGRYVFVYNTQEPNGFKNFTYFRFSIEIAGNSLRLIDKIAQQDYADTTSYNILGINYSQYVRPDFDLRFYQVFSPHASLVYRLAAGIGVAYLNSDFIPYEKTFFAGGANDLRAFRPRTIGPGSYQSDNYVEQLGDIKINANLEYRIDIFKILEGAVFLDAGNVWLKNDNKELPGSQFQLKNFVSELGVGTGLGLRFDFNFFIFRIDGGIPLRDPSKDLHKRWVYKKMDLNLNFGIGYPF
ncbi:MAG: outer membrane protein assembly factor [Bacteroidota bacterium]|nr:outer membrane protein assembly factor [Bacteroidota bacterium]